MSLHDDNSGDSQFAQNNNNISKIPASQQLAPAQSEPRSKSPTMLALEQEQETEPKLYSGGKIQSRSFKMLEQELVDGDSRSSVLSGHNGSNSKLFIASKGSLHHSRTMSLKS